MSITLSKGGKLNLTKKEPALKKIFIGLGWDVISSNTIDLDASVFMVGASGKVPADEYFIFYNNLKSPDGGLQHTGDNRTGLGDHKGRILHLFATELYSNYFLMSLVIKNTYFNVT